MTATCSQFGQANDSPSEIQAIRNAIEQIAAQTYVDHRFILAVIMQESGGCVRVPSTFGSVSNPGLMQDHAGTGTCNSNGNVQNPCPNSEITQMIQDGSE
jgi:isopentenyl diphosphate isomerase/L-lactate dehydrogenase-like FMN-dependent dehydrogenase